MRSAIRLTLVLVLAGAAPWLHGQDQKAEIQKRLSSEFILTKTTVQRDDIVTPGSILVLHKDGLIMFELSARVPSITTYKDGKLSMTFGDAMAITLVLGSNQTASTVPQRKFVSGEKFWLTGVQVTDKHVILLVYSDPYGDVRYYGEIKFPFSKHNVPSADDLMKTISERVPAEPPDNSSQPRNDVARQAAPAPIPTPPPPSDPLSPHPQ